MEETNQQLSSHKNDFRGWQSHNLWVALAILILAILGALALSGGTFHSEDRNADGILVFEGRKIVRVQYQYLASKLEHVTPYQPLQATTCFSIEDILEEDFSSVANVNNIFCTEMYPLSLVLSNSQEFSDAALQGERVLRDNIFALLLIQDPRVYPNQDKEGEFELVSIVDVSETQYDKNFLEKIRPQDVVTIQSDEVATQEWLTYYNKEGGYSLKYPDDWKIEDLDSWEDSRVRVMASGMDSGSVNAVFHKDAYKSRVMSEEFEGALRHQSIYLNGTEGIWVTLKNVYNTCQRHHYLLSENGIDLYEITYATCPEYHPSEADQLYIDVANTFVLVDIEV